MLPPERAAAVAEQAALRRRASSKAGDEASTLYWTPAGLEQATRPGVARRRAARFAELGARDVVDLGCGLGLDALAFAHAGLGVTAVELDEVTAILAEANLDRVGQVLRGDAVALAPGLLGPDAPAGRAVFVDPARRTVQGRTWRVEDFTPPWAFVTGLLAGPRVACAKLGPGLPHGLIPDAVEAEWVSDAGTVVEAALWAGPGTTPGLRRAVVGEHELSGPAGLADAPAGELGDYVYEPDGAVLASGLTSQLADALSARRVHPGVGYLTASELVETPFAAAFRVLDALPYSEKALRGWVRQGRVGVLEIKKRGVDVDPAALRRRLKPTGENAATLMLTPTASGTVALVVERSAPRR